MKFSDTHLLSSYQKKFNILPSGSWEEQERLLGIIEKRFGIDVAKKIMTESDMKNFFINIGRVSMREFETIVRIFTKYHTRQFAEIALNIKESYIPGPKGSNNRWINPARSPRIIKIIFDHYRDLIKKFHNGFEYITDPEIQDFLISINLENVYKFNELTTPNYSAYKDLGEIGL